MIHVFNYRDKNYIYDVGSGSLHECDTPTADYLNAKEEGQAVDTPFVLDTGNIELTLDTDINLPPSSVNALRREAVALLEERFARTVDTLLGKEESAASEIGLGSYNLYSENNAKEINTVLFFNANTALKVLTENRSLLSDAGAIFVPLFDYKKLDADIRKIVNGIYIPPIIMENEFGEVKTEIDNARCLGAKYALVGNISHIHLISGCKLIPVADFRLNITNRYSREFYHNLGIENVILSPELTLPQARDIGGGIVTLGRIPLMITERCFTKENFGCDKCGKASFVDRKGAKFPLMREFWHRNIIFNSAPTYMGDKRHEIELSGIKSTHFIFSSESTAEIKELINFYIKGKPLNYPHRRVGKR